MLRTLFAVALTASALVGCASDPYFYDDPAPRKRGPYDDPVYRGGPYGGGGYAGGPNARRDRDRDNRSKRRMTIEDAQYESVNGKRINVIGYVRRECEGESKCDVKASNKIFGDPDIGAHKDLVVRYRCGNGPTRTVRVPEKKERDIKC